MKKIIVLCFTLALALCMVGCSTDSYKLTVTDQNELLYEQPAKRYQVGEQVVIKTHMLTDVDVECFVNGKSIGKQTAVKTGDEYTHWEYYFEMPAEDVTIKFETVDGMWG